jgi:hypothetical protein
MYYRLWKLPQLSFFHYRRIRRISRSKHAQVVFLVTNLPMWRGDGLLQLLIKDQRFCCHVIAYPISNYTPEETCRNQEVLFRHFEDIDVDYVDATNKDGMKKALELADQADLIFYPQPYGNMYGNRFDNKYHRRQLLCYIPYSFFIFTDQWTANTALHNQAWRIFAESEFHRCEAQRIAHNRGANVVVVGDPFADLFLHPVNKEVWKPQEKAKKRLIWAPHFSVLPNMPLHRNSFLWLCDVMLDIAGQYKDVLQIAFKPHPRLRSVLSSMPEWGQERTDQYFNKWAEISNGQYESGEYIDLFLQSDAMIHDCGAFTVEYLFTGKPVMFATEDIQSEMEMLNGIGREAIAQYYIGTTRDDVIRFIEQVVLQGNDSKQEGRQSFVDRHLTPPNHKTVAQNMYDNLVESLQL